jgi:peroxin-5
MADCSAAGTTIDRATRAIFGGSNQQKHVGALFGHAAMVAGNQGVAAMPRSAPGHLTLPGPSMAQTSSAPLENHPTVTAPSPNAYSAQRMMQPVNNQFHSMPMMNPQQHAMAQQQAMFHQQQQIMQQQMHFMAAQQQQQQQQQHVLQQQRQRMQPPISHQTATQLNDQIHDDLEHWHDGLEEEVKGLQFPEDEHDVLGHDGVAHGASIEELAAAWAQAEAEYEQMADQEQEQGDEDYANLFQGGEHAQHEPQQYEYINKIEEGASLDKNWMEEGMRQFKDGNLMEAIRSFELELQHNNPDNATAWRMLGRCHAENDMDPEAIKCLEAAVDRDPYSPDSLLALGVSYVNELNHERALENMKAWFTHNPKYAGMELPSDIYGASDGSSPKESAFEEVKQLLLSALAFDATDAGDVHEALGVIYNVIKDYASAAVSLRKALETRSDDYQLWNKLGATLANGSQSDQALPAYHRALQLKPKYARAWLNMAISHSNLQDHDEAARCYLQTLSLNPGAKHCWTYLRMALSCAERWDLLPLCFAHDVGAFQAHYDFIYEQP